VKLRELLSASSIVVPLEALGVREATRQLADALAASGAVADKARLAELLKSEWPEDIVAVTERAFLPHFRTDAVKSLALAIGITPAPLCLGNDPNNCARVVVLVVAPTSAAAEYLRTMSAIARALSNDEVLAALHAARSPADVLAIAGLGETVVPPDVTVGDIMTTAVTAIEPEMTLRAAANLMLARSVSAVPVVGPNREVVGLLTDGHLMRGLLPQVVSKMSTGQYRAAKRPSKPVAAEKAKEYAEVQVREVMDRTVLCLSEDQTVADVAALILSKAVDRFPVTREGALVGFLSRSDIVRKLLGT